MRLTIYTGSLIALSIGSFQVIHAQPQEAMDKAPITREAAHALQDRAKAMKAEAERQFERDKVECYKKSFPSSCIDSAKKRMQELLTESHDLEVKGRDGEREARRLEREAKEAQRATGAPRLEAEEKTRSEQLHLEQAKHDTDRAVRLEKETIDVEQRRARIRAEENARSKKREERARRDAENEKSRPMRIREQQKQEKEYAEHAAKIDERKRLYAEELKRREVEAAARLAAEEAEKKNPAKKNSFFCGLLPGQDCTKSGTGR